MGSEALTEALDWASLLVEKAYTHAVACIQIFDLVRIKFNGQQYKEMGYGAII